ncbi:hypothetical protein NYO67_6666 [Aspergillus flavus]|nr:hypothetical protein NYO67_6666 [Aspergillus flavus]
MGIASQLVVGFQDINTPNQLGQPIRVLEWASTAPTVQLKKCRSLVIWDARFSSISGRTIHFFSPSPDGVDVLIALDTIVTAGGIVDQHAAHTTDQLQQVEKRAQ